MADSSIPITAGSGTLVDTRTPADGTEHRQVVVLGDPVTVANVAAVSASGGLETERNPVGTVTTTAVAAVTTAVASNILAAGTTRQFVMIVNDSTARLYLRFDTTLTTATSYAWYLEPGDRYEVPEQFRHVPITGVWSAANGSARVTVG